MFGDQLRGRSDVQDAALVQDGGAVAEPLGFFHVMGGEQDGHAAASRLRQDFPDHAARVGIEAGGGLVEDQHARVGNQGPRDLQAALESAGEALDGLARLFAQAELVEQSLGALCLATLEGMRK